jgi:hypothetical protein
MRGASAIATSWDGRRPGEPAEGSLGTLLESRSAGMMRLVCYLRRGSDVSETCWTWIRRVEVVDNGCRLVHLTAYGRQETSRSRPPRARWGGQTASRGCTPMDEPSSDGSARGAPVRGMNSRFPGRFPK